MIILEGVTRGEVERCSASVIGMGRSAYIQWHVTLVSQFQFIGAVQYIQDSEFQIPIFSNLCIINEIELVERSFINMV